MFPTINHIDDVLPFIKDKEEFSVRDKGDYLVIDYALQTEDSFETMEARECRGIKFWPNGAIAFRGIQKFFNHGERKDLEEQFFNDNFRMFEKMDGSMLHFLPVNGELRAMTKGGVTDVSIQAEKELSKMVQDVDAFKKVYERFYSMGYCPIFEYTSPTNRIVIRQEKPQLTLIVVRDKVSGEYYPLDMFASHLGVPTPQEFDPNDLHQVKEWKEKEGVVLVWKNGYSLKVKADDYVLKHKTKDQLSQEKNVLSFVLSDSVDDLAGILDEDDFNAVKQYHDDVWYGVAEYAKVIYTIVSYNKMKIGEDRKSHAEMIKDKDALYKSMYWKAFDNVDLTEYIVDFIQKKRLNSQTQVDMVRPIIQVKWEDYQ